MDQAIFAGGKRVVEHNRDTALGQSPQLIEIPETVEKSGSPAVAAACCVRRLGHPNRFAGDKAVAQTLIEVVCLIGAREPFLRQSGVGGRDGNARTERGTTLGCGAIEMVGEDVEDRLGGGK